MMRINGGDSLVFDNGASEWGRDGADGGARGGLVHDDDDDVE